MSVTLTPLTPTFGVSVDGLSLKDAAVLTDMLSEAAARGDDIGSPALLARYHRARWPEMAARWPDI